MFFSRKKKVALQNPQTHIAPIQVLGSGCAKCDQLMRASKMALTNLGLDLHIAHVSDLAQIAAYGIMTTPALVIDGQVVSAGRVLTPNEVEQLLHAAGYTTL